MIWHRICIGDCILLVLLDLRTAFLFPVLQVCDFGLSRLKHHTFLSSKSTAGTVMLPKNIEMVSMLCLFRHFILSFYPNRTEDSVL